MKKAPALLILLATVIGGISAAACAGKGPVSQPSEPPPADSVEASSTIDSPTDILREPPMPAFASPIGVPAFPTAEGFGAASVGGRGGEVRFVTNLNNDGPGSFRAAAEQAGARIIVFRVGGIIELRKDIVIDDPYITIAGQTAPGDGICLKNGGLRMHTHDVIVRHVCSRPGDSLVGQNPMDTRNGIRILGGHDIILDHVSTSWGVDETVTIWPWHDTPHDITIQWSIISEGLHDSFHRDGPHSKGMLVGDGVQNISVHHNLFAHNVGRNPQMKGGTRAEIINNVIYNWGLIAIGFAFAGSLDSSLQPVETNVVGNYFQTGADTTGTFVNFYNIEDFPYASENSKIFVSGNDGDDPRLRDFNADPQRFIDQVPYVGAVPAFPTSLAIDPVETVLDAVLRTAGATVPVRDAVDARVVRDVRDGTGRVIDTPADVGGYPVYKSGASPADSDDDGMPDAWETENGLDPDDGSDANGDADSDGYTNIEEYLNELAGD